MNPPARASSFISICLPFVVTFSGSAQQSSADKTESLRLKIAELESTDLKSKSAIVQDLYKRTRQCRSDRTVTPNRNYYRVGFGLDFISFVQKMPDALSKK
jgi:hypothetical protein